MKLIIEALKSDDLAVLQCEGRITYGLEVAEFSRKVAEVVAETQRLAIDLSKVELIDSAGLGNLVMVLLWAQAKGCAVKVAASPRVYELLELTNLLTVFDTHTSLELAVGAFHNLPGASKIAKSHAA